MVLTYTIIAFIGLFIPTIHQLIWGFKAKTRPEINKVGLRSGMIQMTTTLIAYIIFLKIEGANPKLAFEVGMLFLISVGLVVIIQHLLLTLKQGKL